MKQVLNKEPIYQVWDGGNWADYDKATFEAVQGMSARSRIVHTHPAPSIPTVSFYRDGIAAAADWVDKQREAYDSKHGSRDPDTGTFGFGSSAKRDYSFTLAEIAEGIRAFHPNAASAPSISAAVPEDLLSAMEEVLRISDRDHDAWTRAKSAIASCRAAAPKEV